MVKKVTISVAIAVYNEESNLARCLKSVKDWVDEIVVVDGGSSDKTVEIAESFNAIVIHTDNPQIFHVNKQKAIDACKGIWILQLDADEVVTAELKSEILEKVKTGVDGYWIPRKNYFLGHWLKKGGVYPEYTLRLYRNGKGRLPCKTVHEQAQVDGEVGYLKSDLLHYPYANFAGYLAKAEAYTSLTARLWKDQSIKINPITTIKYMIAMPIYTFFNIYIRHLGVLDLFPGFVWALYSALHFPQAYIKLWRNK
ncbi:glycosyl transferase [Candidatus Roizmanbacteria bacterium CG22_combo_CG10-13_8_21_14_all_38_20]|uniref:Glycosyl transferase n=1 Tax=Candidatus Roizmanbacteria bacterium CG22_combo_CG10-13_8_21_14_all_38_20 TaxID=1974862 RepID=A0A2H0BW27_9BACT|nr:glycosyltransferase family 2 protein [Candidatus Microgenomates bacterium]PIP61749.1 MAG: glycosyl transferase [Candidatus Roizmanbacteria bacterium CG22_combo_CG10-13_8_21_14_all_38_20]